LDELIVANKGSGQNELKSRKWFRQEKGMYAYFLPVYGKLRESYFFVGKKWQMVII